MEPYSTGRHFYLRANNGGAKINFCPACNEKLWFSTTVEALESDRFYRPVGIPKSAGRVSPAQPANLTKRIHLVTSHTMFVLL